MEPLALKNMALILPEIFLALSATALLVFGVFRGDRATPTIQLAAGLVLAILSYMFILNFPIARGELLGMFVQDGLTTLGKLLVIISALMALVMATPWLAQESHRRFEFSILFLFAVLGMLLLISANDLLAVYLGLETSSLSLYVLAAFARDDARSSEAGLKYFVLSSLASGIVLFGISLVYGFTGTTHFPQLAEALMPAASQPLPPLGVMVGLILVMIGFCFKVSAVPFHMWTPDVYEGAPTPVTAFFAGAPKIAVLFLFARLLMEPFAPLVKDWQQIVIFVSAASMVIGGLGAITQRNIKRLLAYSSIGHMGFALVGVAAASGEGLKGMVIYLIIYLFMNAGVFALVMQMKRDGKPVEMLEDLTGISRQHPRFTLAMAALMFSMAGIPPLAGFFGKMYVFLAAVDSGLISLAVIGVLASVVSCYYYLKIIKLMYFDDVGAATDIDTSPALRFLVAASVAFNLLFIFYPTGITEPVAATVGAWLP